VLFDGEVVAAVFVSIRNAVHQLPNQKNAEAADRSDRKSVVEGKSGG